MGQTAQQPVATDLSGAAVANLLENSVAVLVVHVLFTLGNGHFLRHLLSQNNLLRIAHVDGLLIFARDYEEPHSLVLLVVLVEELGSSFKQGGVRILVQVLSNLSQLLVELVLEAEIQCLGDAAAFVEQRHSLVERAL